MASTPNTGNVAIESFKRDKQTQIKIGKTVPTSKLCSKKSQTKYS